MASIFSMVGTGYLVYRIHEHKKSVADVDYPAYGVVGPIKSSQIKSPSSSSNQDSGFIIDHHSNNVRSGGIISRSGRSSNQGSGNVSPISSTNQNSADTENSIQKNSSVVMMIGDRRLATSTQIFHYQHQKQQMISAGDGKKAGKSEEVRMAPKEINSIYNHDDDDQEEEEEEDDQSEEEEEESESIDYIVYECSGLAPINGEMEVKNPLFFHHHHDDGMILLADDDDDSNQQSTSSLNSIKSSNVSTAKTTPSSSSH